VSGELAQLGQLAPARLDALDSAVAQCLVNIVRHAGVSSAEVMIGGGNDELTVAVIDTGSGFDESRVPADRIGLRISIRARVEHEGGTVRLWSKPGVGTTIVLTMPRSPR
jgi:signal transduction histidine kinase